MFIDIWVRDYMSAWVYKNFAWVSQYMSIWPLFRSLSTHALTHLHFKIPIYTYSSILLVYDPISALLSTHVLTKLHFQIPIYTYSCILLLVYDPFSLWVLMYSIIICTLRYPDSYILRYKTYPISHSYLAISLSQPTSCPPRPLLPATPSGQFGHFSLTHSGHSLTSSLSHIFSSPLPYDLMFPSFYYCVIISSNLTEASQTDGQDLLYLVS